MVDDKRNSNQNDIEFVQHLFDQVKPEFASPELKVKILMSAPGFKSKQGFVELLDCLWPFGVLWRPVAGLGMAMMFGIMLGLSDSLLAISTVDADDALTEGIEAFVMAAELQLEYRQ